MTEKTIVHAERATRLPEMDPPEGDENIRAKWTEDDPDSNTVWVDRLAEYDPGEIEAFDFDEVMPHLKVEYVWT